MDNSADNQADTMVYGGTLRRIAALLCDSMLLSPMVYLLLYLQSIASISPLLFASMTGVVYWLYYSIMESGRHGASYGKQLLGLRVISEQGDKLRFPQAAVRTLGFVFSLHMPLLIYGYFVQPFTARRQSLYDMLTKSLVIRVTENINKRVSFIILPSIIVGALSMIPMRNENATLTRDMYEVASTAGKSLEEYISVFHSIPLKIDDIMDRSKIKDRRISMLLENTGVILAQSDFAGKRMVLALIPHRVNSGQIQWDCYTKGFTHGFLPQKCVSIPDDVIWFDGAIYLLALLILFVFVVGRKWFPEIGISRSMAWVVGCYTGAFATPYFLVAIGINVPVWAGLIVRSYMLAFCLGSTFFWRSFYNMPDAFFRGLFFCSGLWIAEVSTTISPIIAIPALLLSLISAFFSLQYLPRPRILERLLRVIGRGAIGAH